jgi:hypothetical protein
MRVYAWFGRRRNELTNVLDYVRMSTANVSVDHKNKMYTLVNASIVYGFGGTTFHSHENECNRVAIHAWPP